MTDARADVTEPGTDGASPPRRRWLLGVIGAVVVGGVGWSTLRRRSAGTAPVATTAGVPLVLDFGMDICEQCKKTRALLTRIEGEYAGKIQVRYVDVRDDENEALAGKYGVRMIPLLVLLDGAGAEVWRHEGLPSEAVLREQLSGVVSREGARSRAR